MNAFCGQDGVVYGILVGSCVCNYVNISVADCGVRMLYNYNHSILQNFII